MNRVGAPVLEGSTALLPDSLTTFMMKHRQTQAQRILKAFKENDNTLTLPQIWSLGISQYNARIKELREKGYVIENQYLGTFDGKKHTQFVLKSEPKKYVPPPSETPKGFLSRAHQIAHLNRLKHEKKNEAQAALF